MEPAEASSHVRADLPRRLRALREERWPDVTITQAQLGAVLGEGKPVSVAAISSWESTTSPRMPQPSHLAAYARFFGAMLDQGILMPPSQFEAWFVSMTHGPAEIEATIDAARTALVA